ncbi:MAG: RNA polymerase sigma-54 factor, partial [Spirochaetia bacterium]|nr:RNA polymerase sigma-54 factor [Spirochaetia bacterium]
LMPMTLKDIADSENVNLHDSTVSRITANKFVQTKWGIFQLKYFFSGSLNSQIGTMKHSAKNIQEKIKKLVDEETLENILSDQDLVDRIAAEGILIARRTVAKYRKILNILPAERRKKIKEINLK